MWRHNEAAGEESGVRECVVRMWHQRGMCARECSECGLRGECGLRECVVRMWRQDRRDCGVRGDVASGNVSSECSVRRECGVRVECGRECVVTMWRQGGMLRPGGMRCQAMRRQGIWECGVTMCRQRQALKCYTICGYPVNVDSDFVSLSPSSFCEKTARSQNSIESATVCITTAKGLDSCKGPSLTRL